MQFIKGLFPAIHTASCSWTSKWSSHEKQWEHGALYNNRFRPRKFMWSKETFSSTPAQVYHGNSISKFSKAYHNLEHPLKKTNKQTNKPKPNKKPQRPTTQNQNPTNLLEKSTSLWAPLLCQGASAAGLPWSNRLQAQKVQAIRNCELKAPSSPQNMPWIS